MTISITVRHTNSRRKNQLATLVILLFTQLNVTAQTTSSVEWPAYGNDAGGMRFSPLTQINTQNVTQLTVAWTVRTGELEQYKGTNAAEKAAFEATPIMVDGTLFFSTPTSRVFAVDAVTGQKKWEYNPEVYLWQELSEITSRGVSFWPVPGDKQPLMTTQNEFLWQPSMAGSLRWMRRPVSRLPRLAKRAVWICGRGWATSALPRPRR